MAPELKAPLAAVRDQDGCLRFNLNPAILLTSKTIKSKCIESWRTNRLVRVTYKGDACFRPTAFVPVTGKTTYTILSMPLEQARSTFVADLNVTHKLMSSNDVTGPPTENVCVVTIDAVCTWLAILGCIQTAEQMYTKEAPALELELFVHNSVSISGPVGGDLYQAIALMPHSSTRVIAKDSPKMILPSPGEVITGGSLIYGEWISSTCAHRHAYLALRNLDAQLDHCTYTCKLLISLHHLESGSDIMKGLTHAEQTLVAQQTCAALLNWAYEYHRRPRDEESLAKLKESWQSVKQDTCTIDGCPCLLWSCLDLAGRPIVSRDDAARHGINFPAWLEVHRWTIALHCRRRLAEEDFDGLVDAKEQMLKVGKWIRPGEQQKSFALDMTSFTIAASKGIRGLADHRGVMMVDEDVEAQVDVLWDSLSLVKERIGRMAEWRVQEHSVILENPENTPSHVAVESDIIPTQLLASLFAKRKQ